MPVQFAFEIPERAPLIERIEDQIAPFGTVELLDELARRVVDDARFSPCFDLPEDLPNCVYLPLPVSPMSRIWLDSSFFGMRKLRPRGPSFDLNRRLIPSAFALRLHRKADTSSGPLVRRPCRSSCFDRDRNQLRIPNTRTIPRAAPNSGVNRNRIRLCPSKNSSFRNGSRAAGEYR